MRTNIVIDDTLMEEAMEATGSKTKREAVELGLRTLLRLNQQLKIREFRGKLAWQGDLEAMRNDHSEPPRNDHSEPPRNDHSEPTRNGR